MYSCRFCCPLVRFLLLRRFLAQNELFVANSEIDNAATEQTVHIHNELTLSIFPCFSLQLDLSTSEFMRNEQEELDKHTQTHAEMESERHSRGKQERIRATEQLLRQIDLKRREFLSRERIAYIYSRHRIKGLSLLIVLP